MRLPRVNPIGIVEYPEGYAATPREYTMRFRVAAASVLTAFLVVVVVTTVYTLGAYCLTTRAGSPVFVETLFR